MNKSPDGFATKFGTNKRTRSREKSLTKGAIMAARRNRAERVKRAFLKARWAPARLSVTHLENDSYSSRFFL